MAQPRSSNPREIRYCSDLWFANSKGMCIGSRDVNGYIYMTPDSPTHLGLQFKTFLVS